jgi:C_GCAxxG_C_C family probable redox protein
VCEERSISCNVIPRISSGLSHGMAHTGGMCGALSGGILALGLINGRDSADTSMEPLYTQVQSLITLFREHHGSTSCPDLLECDLNTEEGQVIFKREHRIERCERFVADTASIIQRIAPFD